MQGNSSEREALTGEVGSSPGSTSKSSNKCPIYCCSCCCCLIITLVVFLGWFMSGAQGARYFPVGPNTVTLGFASDMLSLLSGEGVPGYANSWCPEGLPCTRENFPGPDTTSYTRWDEVWEIGKQYPEKEWSGEWWRGNELGYIINNPKFWSHLGISPQSIALGINPNQHASIRPIMEDMWGLSEKGSDSYERTAGIIKKHLDAFFKRPEFAIPGDTTALVHQILMEVALKREVSWDDAMKFVGLQSQVVALGTIGQLIPGFLAGATMGSISDGVVEYVREYTAIMEKLYGDRLKGLDCAPSANCSVQAAAACWDALYAAGGLSVPGTINTGLGILYSTDGSNPAPGVTYTKDQALQFYWENIRFFPPVVGFPHWTTRPTCAGSTPEETAALNKPDGKSEACTLGGNTIAGYPEVNQYLGGVREVPNLALAMSDPTKWGKDSNKFVNRPLKDYDDYSVGFAEMAVNNDIAGGKMNRICPGKELALLIGSMFFEEFDMKDWVTSDSVSFKATTPFVGGFTLKKASSSFAHLMWAPARVLMLTLTFCVYSLHVSA